jgi:hypothetical protein
MKKSTFKKINRILDKIPTESLPIMLRKVKTVYNKEHEKCHPKLELALLQTADILQLEILFRKG